MMAATIQGIDAAMATSPPSLGDSPVALPGTKKSPSVRRRDCGAACRNMAEAGFLSNAAVAHAIAPAASHAVTTMVVARPRGCAKGAIATEMMRMENTYTRTPTAIKLYRTGSVTWKYRIAQAQSSVLVAALNASCN